MNDVLVTALCIFFGFMAGKILLALFKPKTNTKIVSVHKINPDGSAGELLWKACPPHKWGDNSGRLYCSNCKKYVSEI